MKNRLQNFILSVMLLIGLSLLLYPSFSNYWNSFHSSKAISNYTQIVSEMDEEEYQRLLAEVYAYNTSLLTRDNPYLLTDSMTEQYQKLLNLDGSGAMGFVEIPSIDVEIPVYHTVEERILQKAVGHIPWTSLPVGGESTHCVLSGHRGLPTARLFTDMDKVVVGDVFYLHILEEVLEYQVDQILIVGPRDTEELLIVPGEDYCTLVTCTPYGVNTHRMLVRGKRVPSENKPKVNVTSEAIQIEPIIVAPVLAIPMLLLLLIWLYIPKPRKVRYRGENDVLNN
ncbi:MAG: class C sortase [Oscillospiraceae bacterium]|nr:class C sortase [Oscillospiraceae bacterium]